MLMTTKSSLLSYSAIFICKGYTSSKSNSAFVKNKANIFFNALKNEGKAKFEEVGTFFTNRFPSLGIFFNKKVGNRKN